MPKAKKLPSGSWRCRVEVGTETINGKTRRIIESVTVKDPSEDGRLECERLARKLEKASKKVPREITVKDALDIYIQKRKEISRSASTVSGYQSLAKCAYKQLLAVPIRSVTDDLVNEWMKEYRKTHSPKTCRNAYGLLSSAIRTVNPAAELSAELPDPEPLAYYDPTDQDVRDLLAAADLTMKKAILLAAYGSLRSGETCALTYGDIQGNRIIVSKDMVWDTDSRCYILWPCKNAQSRRSIIFPPEIIDALLREAGRQDERVVPYNPRSLSARFARLRHKCGLDQMRYHDLRAYAASFRHAIGIPSAFISSDGGWRQDSPVMKRVYIRAMEDRRKQFSELAGEHFVSQIRVTSGQKSDKIIEFIPDNNQKTTKNEPKKARSSDRTLRLTERMGFEPMRPDS